MAGESRTIIRADMESNRSDPHANYKRRRRIFGHGVLQKGRRKTSYPVALVAPAVFRAHDLLAGGGSNPRERAGVASGLVGWAVLPSSDWKMHIWEAKLLNHCTVMHTTWLDSFNPPPPPPTPDHMLQPITHCPAAESSRAAPLASAYPEVTSF
ncbi:hypothetical protein EYF80_027920 [Liparis tanakae]|uniref:Uncharacterized protein n=1 Tax=Liparis tanakae TaxID=230148 RepID=A0A4Z2HAJ0_9TELE|nr:hypothetical protein EYF80_027920 [Liparis tanakae]